MVDGLRPGEPEVARMLWFMRNGEGLERGPHELRKDVASSCFSMAAFPDSRR